MLEIVDQPRPGGHSTTAATGAKVTTAAASDRQLADSNGNVVAGAAAGAEPLPVAIIDGQIDKQSFSYVWRTGVAGGLAGCAAKTIVAPLDRVKILFQASNPQYVKYSGSWAGVAQTMRLIYQQDGPLGLFRGHSATLLRVFPYAAVKFLAYEQIRSFIIPRKEHETPLRRLLSGSLAGVTSVFFTYPLELIRVRLAFETRRDTHSSLLSICRRIYVEHPATAIATATATATTATTASSMAKTPSLAPPRSGIINFYRGFSPTILGMLPYAGMSFLTHDTCGDLLRLPLVAAWTTLPQPTNAPPGKPAPLRAWAELLAGGIAGLVSQTASYPLEVIRRRMQVGGAVGDGHRFNIAETARLIMHERGLRGFFVGLTIGYVKVMPMAAAAFYTYERLKRHLGV
ncbi:mitochondrial carrier protein [Grosmannia clavigera kw1407]|uniref:Mitochondrial thiamine pyrophosphate carrier 1 n=1 Tax=Grosmannia clavigera (strain kw1407 / UAMH 11150) TaxID=655863 RepID=F0XUT5_GROCL|nr:mitochondrial carrier protein [Grosmannia clavigera kw1407]EFW98546.1 mitochondrial carrier protein [Grosmannia clavigera kw1407]